MIFDADNILALDGTDYDICIIGGGVAGITIAQALDPNLKVCILEAGGLTPSLRSQQCYEGKVTGDKYFPLIGARLRFLGGSSGHWTGMCRGFEEVDFQRGYLGEQCIWPIHKSDLDVHLDAACKILDIENDFKDASDDATIRGIKFSFSPPVRMGSKYFDFLKGSNNISVLLNSNFLDVNESPWGYVVNFANYQNERFKLSSKKIVFAMGGIENSRFLLNLQVQKPGELFSSGLPIGKYWMEHPHFSLGEIIVEKQKLDFSYLAINGALQIKSGIMNCGFRVNQLGGSETTALIRDIACFAPDLGRRFAKQFDKDLLCGFKLRAAWEQEPVVGNNIQLDDTVDQFGIPRAILHWKKTPLDFKTIRKSLSILNNYLIEEDIGRVRLLDWLTNGEFDYPDNDELAGYHHMGGTRMHHNRKFGVVDQNCKVFGSKSIYIAGSSVFTTGGHNNPTLPIVQLGLRLASHLNENC